MVPEKSIKTFYSRMGLKRMVNENEITAGYFPFLYYLFDTEAPEQKLTELPILPFFTIHSANFHSAARGSGEYARLRYTELHRQDC